MSHSWDSSAAAKPATLVRDHAGHDPCHCHLALSHLVSPLGSLLLHCNAASITSQQQCHTDVWLGGSVVIVPTPKFYQFPLHSPTTSSAFRNFQQRGFDNQSCSMASLFQSQLFAFFHSSDFLSCKSTISSSLLRWVASSY